MLSVTFTVSEFCKVVTYNLTTTVQTTSLYLDVAEQNSTKIFENYNTTICNTELYISKMSIHYGSSAQIIIIILAIIVFTFYRKKSSYIHDFYKDSLIGSFYWKGEDINFYGDEDEEDKKKKGVIPSKPKIIVSNILQ